MSYKQLPKKRLGNSDFMISQLGVGCGCLGPSAFYTTNPISEEESIKIIKLALDLGYNHFDTASSYIDNEKILGKAIKLYGREKFFIATKVPYFKFNENKKPEIISQNKEFIKQSCYQSLKELGIDCIDLFYSHRVDKNLPIEDQAQAFKELIQEGKIKSYGLSEVSVETIRRAHKICPVSAVQEEYSLFTRDIEQNGVFQVCQELDISLIAYSPLSRGILSGKIGDLKENDMRTTMIPRFQQQALEQNLKKVEQLNKIAEELKATPSQIALAWLLKQGDFVFPIPGTRREKYMIQNQESAFVELSQEQMKFLSDLFPVGSAVGERGNDLMMSTCNADTVSIQ